MTEISLFVTLNNQFTLPTRRAAGHIALLFQMYITWDKTVNLELYVSVFNCEIQTLGLTTTPLLL